MMAIMKMAVSEPASQPLQVMLDQANCYTYVAHSVVCLSVCICVGGTHELRKNG